MIAFWSALGFVVLAEMGDKTQLLAMAFAARFSWKTVMLGVFAATLFNHLLAVWVGSWLTSFIPMNVISIGASLSFILFGLWTLRGDKLNGEDQKNCGRSPFWTVALAFFMAEMGDKTQLATIALAAQFHTVIPVWAGTTTGMMIADGAGILLGGALGKKLSDRTIRLGAAAIFILCGIWGLYESL
ncbi:MAG TPA: UPF0016 domain-containing protein [Veillonellaceae bacterium]|jgi:putative Ca2+/H+ antiporter (TMEM165/GDT1 family)|nr:UPF0016 domain-containing protein [Veillonellaceae bacterium]